MLIIDSKAQEALDLKCRFHTLNQWLDSQAGERITRRVSRQFSLFLPKLYGSHLLQLGLEEKHQWLSHSAIYQHYFLLPFSSAHKRVIHGDLQEIPLVRESVDVIIAPLTLNLLSEQTVMLDEIERVLRPSGHVLFINVHPYGYWGHMSQWLNLPAKPLQQVSLISSGQLDKELISRGLQTLSLRYFYHAPPFVQKRMIQELFHQAGSLLPVPSTFYCLLAKKQRLRPLKPYPVRDAYVLGQPH